MRAQLKHVLLDVDFLNNPKIRTLKGKFGQLSQLCLIDIYSAMSKATNAIIDEDCIISILSEYKLNDEFLAYCLDKRLIHPEMNGYSNSVVIKDQEQYFKKLNSGKKRNISEQKREKSENENAPPDFDSDFDNDIDIDLDLKRNGQTNILTLPESLQCDEVFSAVANWQRKLHSQGRTLNQGTLDAQLMCLGLNKARILAAINYSCSRTKCLNLIEPPEKPPDKQPFTKTTNYDRNKEQILKSLKEAQARD